MDRMRGRGEGDKEEDHQGECHTRSQTQRRRGKRERQREEREREMQEKTTPVLDLQNVRDNGIRRHALGKIALGVSQSRGVGAVKLCVVSA